VTAPGWVSLPTATCPAHDTGKGGGARRAGGEVEAAIHVNSRRCAAAVEVRVWPPQRDGVAVGLGSRRGDRSAVEHGQPRCCW